MKPLLTIWYFQILCTNLHSHATSNIVQYQGSFPAIVQFDYTNMLGGTNYLRFGNNTNRLQELKLGTNNIDKVIIIEHL